MTLRVLKRAGLASNPSSPSSAQRKSGGTARGAWLLGLRLVSGAFSKSDFVPFLPVFASFGSVVATTQQPKALMWQIEMGMIASRSRKDGIAAMRHRSGSCVMARSLSGKPDLRSPAGRSGLAQATGARTGSAQDRPASGGRSGQFSSFLSEPSPRQATKRHPHTSAGQPPVASAAPGATPAVPVRRSFRYATAATSAAASCPAGWR